MAKTIVFDLDKETKNTIRYAENASGEPPIIGTIYVQKWFLGEKKPPKITVTVDF